MSEHITIGDVSPRALYIANGTQRDFTFAFPIFNNHDLEIRIDGLTQATGYTIAGAGESDGGIVTFIEAPPNGARIMLRRRVTLARMTDFQENSVLRASALNDELDFQMAALQQVASDLSQAIRTDPADDGNMLLPLRAARGNRLLGFDSLGDIAIFDRDGPEITLPYSGAVPRAVEDKLNERLSVRDFGALGNGVADDGPALQAVRQRSPSGMAAQCAMQPNSTWAFASFVRAFRIGRMRPISAWCCGISIHARLKSARWKASPLAFAHLAKSAVLRIPR